MTPRRIPVLVPLLLVLAGCGGGGPGPTPSPTAATTSPASGPAAFLADVDATGFGKKDTADPAFVDVGNVACQGLASGVSYGQQVSAFVTSDAGPSQRQAEVLVRSAVANLCPEYRSMLP